MSEKKNRKSRQGEATHQEAEQPAAEVDSVPETGRGAETATARKVVRQHYAIATLPVSPFKGYEDRPCVAVCIVRCPKGEVPNVGNTKHKLIRVVCVKTVAGSRNHQTIMDISQQDCDTMNSPPKPVPVGSGEAAVKFIRAAADSYNNPMPHDLQPDETPTILSLPDSVA